MKKTLIKILFSMMLLSIFTCTAMAETINVYPTASQVSVNSVQVDLDAYTIDGSNYFKLRDLAMVLKDTNKGFSVGYDSASNTVIIDTKGTYTSVGSELVVGNKQAMSAVKGSGYVQLNGKAK